MRQLLRTTTTLALTLFLAVGMAFGQASNPNKEANIDQSGNNPSKPSEADIVQDGVNFDADIFQGVIRGGQFGFGLKNADADIRQEGDGATAKIYQGTADNLASSVEATIDQEATGNGGLEATIQQGHNRLGANNKGKAETGTKATVDQVGENQDALVQQGVNGNAVADEAVADVDQRDGGMVKNEVTVRQGFRDGYARNVTANVFQDGSDLSATVRQGVRGASATQALAEITQNGAGLDATITQSN